MLYLYGDFYFDNLKNVNKEVLLKLAKIYNKKVKNQILKICSIK